MNKEHRKALGEVAEQWLRTSTPGRAILYYTGFLMFDRETQPKDDADIYWAGLFWKAYEDGLVTLVQQRNGPGDYYYFAQRTRRKFDDNRTKGRKRGY